MKTSLDFNDFQKRYRSFCLAPHMRQAQNLSINPHVLRYQLYISRTSAVRGEGRRGV